MKLKGKKLVVHADDLHLECEEFEMEMGLEEIKEMNKHNARSDYSMPPLFKGIKELYYSGTLTPIKVEDQVVILSSENCNTNADTIKYDERIDGLKCTVLAVNRLQKTVAVLSEKQDRRFDVMASWLIKQVKGKKQ